MMRVLIVAALALATFAADANAQMVLTREAGRVRFQIAPWTEPVQPIRVRPGEAVWNESVVIPDSVRLLKDVAARVRPTATEVRSGTILYGYQLLRGVAYCAPFDLTANYVRRVQCFRDFNADGIFDGAYVAASVHGSFRAFPEEVFGLAGQRGATNYEGVTEPDLPRMPARAIFERVSDGVPELRLELIGLGDYTPGCAPVAPGECQWLGVTLRYTVFEDGSVEIAPVGLAGIRQFMVSMSDAR